tara:strand:+ start:2972 stop:4666 length:1695 start_codon:yes stop_codon:yes gene_type:complete
MAKVTRSKLSRGLKLLVEQVFDPISAVASELSLPAKLVSRDQRDEQWGKTRLTWSVPAMGDCPEVLYTAPVILPPLQEEWNLHFRSGIDYRVELDTPSLVLDEIQFSFDQRAEPALVSSGGHSSGIGKIDYDVLSDCKFFLSVDEKIPNVAQSENSYLASREIASLELDGVSFMDPMYRLNPFRMSFSKPLNPYRTYVVRFRAVGLNPAAGKYFNLPGLQFSIVVRRPLVKTESSVASQNKPSVAIAGAQSVVPTVPASNTAVEAGNTPLDQVGGDGIAANLMKLENVFRSKLSGGRHKDGSPPDFQHLLEDAGYEIIVVPMWGNFGAKREVNAANAYNCFPYLTSPAQGLGTTGVRQFLFLDYPLEIHHVFAVVNYCQRSTGINSGRHPTSATYTNRVTVEMATGLRGDLLEYATLADQSWTPANKSTKIVDRVLEFNGTTGIHPAIGLEWTHEIYGVPLTSSAPGGVGFVGNGRPIYVGKGSSRTFARSTLGGSAPATAGAEQWLEIRWTMTDAGGLMPGTSGDPANGAAGNNDEIYVGQGGHFVYLVCKKMGMGGSRDVRV